MRSVRAAALFGCLVLAACGGQSPTPEVATSQNEDHWETASDLRFTYAERCGTGPFEIRFPARDIDWGRRITIEVYGERTLPLRYSIRLENAEGAEIGSSGSFPDTPGESARCRTSETTDGASTGEAASGEVPAGAVRAPLAGAPVSEGGTVELAAPPTLTPLEIAPLGWPKLATAIAYYPHGVPHRYRDDIQTWQYDSEAANGAVVLRVWLTAPGDFEGVVLRFQDQHLVPDIPVDEYARTYPEQLLAQRAHSAEHREEERVRLEALRARCDVEPSASECRVFEARPHEPPPPPVAETRPTAPTAQAGIDVDWIPGFWRWVPASSEYVWIGGTYVVRPREVVAEVVTAPPPVAPSREAPPPAAPPPPPPAPAAPPAAPRELTVEVAPPPAPRVETIPAPPRIPGVVWVAGRWELRGTTWAWVPGAWQLPPMPGGRPVAPEIRERGGVRVYLPGGWIDIR